MSPSGSLTVLVQTNNEEVTTPELGEIAAPTSNSGSLLVTVTEADDEAVAPSESVNVATQVKSAFGAELLDDKVRLEPLATKVPLASCHS